MQTLFQPKWKENYFVVYARLCHYYVIVLGCTAHVQMSLCVPRVTRSCPSGCQAIHSNPACLVVKTPQLATRMTTYEKLSQFIPQAESIAAYLKRVELFSTVNTIPGDKKVAVFLSVVGGKIYPLLWDVLAPEKL